MTDDKRARLYELLNTFSFATGDFILASGKKSTYYFDFRAVASNPEAMKLVGEIFFENMLAIKPRPDAIAGAIFGAAPIVTAMTIESYLRDEPITGLYVRKEPKKYGKQNYIEGYMEPGREMKILMIEDVITTGGSILRAIEHLKESAPNLTVMGVLALLDRLEGGTENIKNAGYPLKTLFTINDFLMDD